MTIRSWLRNLFARTATHPLRKAPRPAKSIPWSPSIPANGFFESAEELQTLSLEQKGIDPEQPTITYCRIPGMHQIIE
jgi:3-mercaptopyruvate sulfurtransferase SseA